MGKETIGGTVDSIIWPKPGSSIEAPYSIISLKTDRERVTAKLSYPALRKGMDLSLTGKTVNNKYGRTFVAESVEEIEPTSAKGILKYLSSGIVEGIGPTLAERIVKTFGDSTLKVLNNDTGRLKEVPGIGPKKLESITEEWQHHKAMRETMIFLRTYGVGNADGARIYKEYGKDTKRIILNNPYRLANDIDGIGFKKADLLAMSLARYAGTDFHADGTDRIHAAMMYCMREATEKQCHTYLTSGELLDSTEKTLKENTPQLELSGKALPDTLNAAVRRKELEAGGTEPLRLYIPRYLRAERNVAASLAHQTGKDMRQFNAVSVEELEKECGITYDDKQKEAIETALSHPLCIITGGPGTGKTTITRAIIKAEEMNTGRPVLAAPTGRAAKRMTTATGHEASTIHRLLEFAPGNGFLRNEDFPLEGTLLIIDEASMIDILLMENLMKAVNESMRVVFIGDADQLPSVSTGNVFRDMVRTGERNEGIIPTVKLEHIYRQENSEENLITTNAHRINSGQLPVLPKGMKPGHNFAFCESESPEDAQGQVLSCMMTLMENGFGLDDIQVLTPKHKGPIGTDALNAAIQEMVHMDEPSDIHISRGATKFMKGDRVMQTSNRYDWNVFNGDMGKIRDIDTEDNSMTIDFNGTQVKALSGDLQGLSLAYACTIHKSQGSEFPAAIVLTTASDYFMLNRNMIYTAITRAKRMCVMIGDRNCIQWSIGKNEETRRNSMLEERITEEYGKHRDIEF